MMKKRWGFWTFWVSINAFAGFIWSLIVTVNTLSSFSGKVLGVICFIIFYTLIDDYARQRNWQQFIISLQKAVYIKAGLQFLNLLLVISLFISPEFIAGLGGLCAAESLWSESAQPLLFTFTATIVTGTLLSLLVAVITFTVSLLSKPNNEKLTNLRSD